MARLTQRKFQKVLECIGEIYTHHDLDSFARHAMAVAAKAIPSDHLAYSELNVRRKRLVSFADKSDVDVTMSPEAQAQVFRDHPFLHFLKRFGDVPALRISDFLSQREYRETGLYREVYGPGNVEYQLGCTLPAPSPQLSVGFTHNRKHRDFSEEDRLVLDLLRAHFFQAYRNAELVTQLRESTALATQALESLPHVIVKLDARGRLCDCPPRARQWLANYFGPTSTVGTLPDVMRRWLNQSRLPGARASNLPAPRQPLTVERAGWCLTIRLLADSPTGQMLACEERQTELSATPLQKLGLTARQAEVLLWVAQGKTNPEIGKILGLSAGTVHKHTEHIFAKLGVETRTAAAQRAYEVFRLAAP